MSTLSTYEHINDLTGGGYVFLCRKKVRTLIFSHPGYFSDFFLYTPSRHETVKYFVGKSLLKMFLKILKMFLKILKNIFENT